MSELLKRVAEVSGSVLDLWVDPSPEQIGSTAVEFLKRLEKPTLIKVTGKESSRCRAVSTLLHGNEPSGFFALHRWLLEQQPPECDSWFFLGGVYAAKIAPGFVHRQIPGQPDLNRCFKEPFDGTEGQIAEAFLNVVHELRPECLIDVHNTSGMGPAFALTICNDSRHQALVDLFTERLIVTDLRMGTVMEISELEVPTVTIEVGGAQDEHAHQLAYDGLKRYLHLQDVLTLREADWKIEVLTNPIRIELLPEATIAYDFSPRHDVDVVLPPDVEHFNFGVVKENQQIGWVGEKGLSCFKVFNSLNENIAEKLFRVKDGMLLLAQPIKSFMITTNPVIAKSDCLFYAVTDEGHQIL